MQKNNTDLVLILILALVLQEFGLAGKAAVSFDMIATDVKTDAG